MIIVMRELSATSKLLAELEYSKSIPNWLAQAQWIAMSPKLYWRTREAMLLSEAQKKEQREERNRATFKSYKIRPRVGTEDGKTIVFKPTNSGGLATIIPFRKKENP